MMIGLRWLCAMGVTAVMLVGCKPAVNSVCKETDKVCMVKAMLAHPVKSVSTWRAELEKPVAQRVDVASTSLIEFLALDNRINGYAERPAVPALDPSFQADFMAALNALPPAVLNVAGNRLVGIRFVANLGSSGFTDYVYDTTG